MRRLSLGDASIQSSRGAALALLLAPLPARAQQAPAEEPSTEAPPSGPSRAEQRCQTYKALWADLLAKRGKAGLGEEFVARQDAFIASGCDTRADVCPRTPAELAVANALVIAIMNAARRAPSSPSHAAADAAAPRLIPRKAPSPPFALALRPMSRCTRRRLGSSISEG